MHNKLLEMIAIYSAVKIDYSHLTCKKNIENGIFHFLGYMYIYEEFEIFF